MEARTIITYKVIEIVERDEIGTSVIFDISIDNKESSRAIGFPSKDVGSIDKRIELIEEFSQKIKSLTTPRAKP